jgi:hypothetical protein
LGGSTLDQRHEFKIASPNLTINGLVLRVKESVSKILSAILSTLLNALEEKVVKRYLGKEPERFRKTAEELSTTMGR